MALPRLPKMPKYLRQQTQPHYNSDTARFVNLTGHPINYINDDGSITVIPVSGTMSRVTIVTSDPKDVAGFRMERMRNNGELSDLPAKQEGYYYIVSHICKMYIRNREDVLCPAKLVKSPDGSRVLGCRGFGY